MRLALPYLAALAGSVTTLGCSSEPPHPTVTGLLLQDGVPLEAEVTDHMLFVRNQDRPGLIGGLGTVLGDAGVNIASFHLGRRTAGEDAVALVAVDEALPDDLLTRVSGLPNVLSAKALRF